jgi:uncharacterized protein HemX
MWVLIGVAAIVMAVALGLLNYFQQQKQPSNLTKKVDDFVKEDKKEVEVPEKNQKTDKKTKKQKQVRIDT